jgi:threonine/homoserine/homoserine lactone efflux protein
MLEIAGIEVLPDLPRFLAFAMAGLALNMIPGADMTYVMASAARGGTRSGLAAALGISAGALIHLAAAVVGLSALIASSQAAFTILKWAGAAYLLYLAVQIIRTPSGGDEGPPYRAVASSNAAIFRSGALVNVLNPKIALFFLAFLPQFVNPSAELPAVQILALGIWFNFVGTIVNAIVAIATARAASGLRRIKWAGPLAKWLAAIAMAGLALQLAISKSR